MKAFSRRGFQLRGTSLETRVAYTGFLLLTVPGAATTGLIGDILEPQARLISNAAAPFDSSHVVGETLLVTP